MSDLPRRVLAQWTAIGIARDDVDELRSALDYLARLERERRVVLPESFRELWQLSDGTASMDNHELLFWPLDNILEDPSLPDPRPEGFLLFADQRLGARQFFVRFERGSERGVSTLRDTHPDDVRTIAPSFDAFLETYLAHPESLLLG
jgi:hypothetical protein